MTPRKTEYKVSGIGAFLLVMAPALIGWFVILKAILIALT